MTEKEQQLKETRERVFQQWEAIVRNMAVDGVYTMPPSGILIKVDRAKERLESLYSYLLSTMGEEFQYFPELDQVADWLSNNDRKGLILYGPCGRGKTFLARYVLPVIIKCATGYLADFFDAADAIKRTDDVLASRVCIIDDVGTEGEFVEYGSRRKTIDEAMDAVEKRGNLLIMTSNLHDGDEFRTKYGDRFYDRMKKHMHSICFRGASLRNPDEQEPEPKPVPNYTNNHNNPF